MKTTASLLALLLCFFAVSLLVPSAFAKKPPANSAPSTTPAPGSPGAVICLDPDLVTLCRIIKSVPTGEGAERLRSNQFSDTVFAPLDSAFTNDAKKVAHELSINEFNDIFSNEKAADRLLKNLIIPDQAITSKAFKEEKFKSLLGQNLKLNKAWFTSQYYIESEEISALIVKPDVAAGKAVIHKVDRVPVPDDFL